MLYKDTYTTKIVSLATIIRKPLEMKLSLTRPISKAGSRFRFFDQIYSKGITTPDKISVFGE